MEEAPKQSILKKLTPMLLAIAISLLFIIPVHAESYDFDEGDPAAKGSKEILGGPSYTRSGVIFYLVDENGKYVGIAPVAYTY